MWRERRNNADDFNIFDADKTVLLLLHKKLVMPLLNFYD